MNFVGVCTEVSELRVCTHEPSYTDRKYEGSHLINDNDTKYCYDSQWYNAC